MAQFIIQKQENTSTVLSTQEEKIVKILQEHEVEEYDELLKHADGDVFFHLGTQREGLFNWYPFDRNEEILLVSSGFGALAGVLSRKCKQLTIVEEAIVRAECIAKRYVDVDNITIIVNDLNSFPLEKKYGYVIVENQISTEYELNKTVNTVFPFLKDTGKLLLVCKNRFGMKYWCGVPGPLEKEPFAGIRGKSKYPLMTRQHLIESLQKNEQVEGFRLYYPFPDSDFPQAVYSDQYLPKASVRDRVIPYYRDEERHSLVCLENEICDDLIANNVFHIFANTILVECSKKDFEPEVLFAALSTDRGKEHGFATIITGKDVVRKQILHPDGLKSLQLLHENCLELKRRGISCVDEKFVGDAIEMPFVKAMSLIEYLKYLFFNCSDKVEAVFELLYENIVQSSESVSFEMCAIKNIALTQESAGIILSKAYIDMIPYNCFYNDGELLFYDQEFVRENFPANYVLFRALRYTYIYIEEADSIIPLQYFKDKFGLSKIWHVFEREEAKFVESNRNYDVMSAFYKWASISAKEVDSNIEKLTEKKEEKKSIPPFRRHRYDLSDYGKDIVRNAAKEVQLQILKKFIEVCEENGLTYCLCYGTLLGAVRHKGFIPWDDDIDVLMPREDYDKLLEIGSEGFGEPYFLQTPENDEGCFYGGYCKLRNSDTTGLEERNKGHQCNQGIWIDVFPLDYVLEDEKEKERQNKTIQFYQRLLIKKTYPEKRMLWDIDAKAEGKCLKLSKLFSRELLCRKLKEAIIANGYEKADKVAVLARYWAGKQYTEYDSSLFAFVVPGVFEGETVNLPCEYEKCLQQEYGLHYMQYPAESNRKPHHKVTLDAKKPYKDYIS